MKENYVYLGEDLQLESLYLRKYSVISIEDLKKLEKKNKKIKDLFIGSKKFSEIKLQLNDPKSFYSQKINRAFKEVKDAI